MIDFIFDIHRNASIPTLLIGVVVMAVGAIAFPFVLKILSVIAFPLIATYAFFLFAVLVFRVFEALFDL